MKKIDLKLRYNDVLDAVKQSLCITSNDSESRVHIYAMEKKEGDFNKVLTVTSNMFSFEPNVRGGYLIHSQDNWDCVTENIELEILEISKELIKTDVSNLINYLSHCGINVNIIQ